MKKNTKKKVPKKNKTNNVKVKVNKKHKKFKQRKIGEKILILLMLLLITITIIGVSFFLYVIIKSPSFSEEALYSQESSIIYDIEGNEYARIGSENRELVTYDEMPEVLIDAILATEDSRFMQHSGVDLARFLKASFGQLFGNSDAGGASTLTMQIVKQRFTDDTATGIKGIIRKFTDVYMAVFKIEKKYTKEQILEFYVNIPFLGSGAYGIEQASQIYFGKSVGELTLSEAATIAGLFQAPGAYDPYVNPEKAEARRNQVLNLMERHKYISKEERDLAKKIPIAYLLINDEATINQNQGVIDTIVEEVKTRTKQDPFLVSMKIYSTINVEKQKIIDDIYSGNSSVKWANDQLQAGIAVIDVKTGGIAAVGAGRNKKRQMGWNFATMNNRHPGSTAKPIFDYAPAFEFLNWGTGTMVIDDVHGYTGGTQIKNWDNSYKGIMTAKTALAASRNIPALWTFQQLPQRQLKEFVTSLGIRPEYGDNEYIHEGHSIGGFTGVSPLEMAAAFSAFARGGVYIEPHSITKIEFEKTGDIYTVTPEKRTVMKDSTAYMINNTLRYAVTNGYVVGGSVSGTDICGKTGTSTVDKAILKEKGIKSSSVIGDSWQIGYSPDYTIATWIGYEEITKDYYLTNSLGSSTRNSVAKALNTGILEKNSRFKMPSSVVTVTIELETNPTLLASEFTPNDLKSVEYYRKGTAPSEVSTRFSKLKDPSNLNVSYQNGIATLTWDPIATPDAIDEGYLNEYFSEGYSKWAEKYKTKRISYNASNIGNIGYQIYVDTGSGLQDIGWTSSNTFTYNQHLNNDVKFVIKSAYSIFKANMSNGISKTLDIVSTVSIEMETGNCINLDFYNNLNGRFIKVLDSNTDITNQATITNSCYQNDVKISCSEMTSDGNYIVKPSVTYNGLKIPNNIALNINPLC
ncbi:MAG: hypothetical protein GX675_02020 [Erysipelotrichaceae bacterium]|nr:hypothetical protein [Erysipelotrichaceae bacterium]